MIKIIPLTKERITKFSIFGADISIGFAKYAYQTLHPSVTEIRYTTGIGWHSQPINYHFDSTEENEIITTRLILWRMKIEIKTVVQYDFKFA